MINILHLLIILPFLACSEPPKETDNTLKKELLVKYKKMTKDFSIPTISAKELKKNIRQEDVLLIDVREEREQTISIIPNAISVQEFEKTPNQHKGKKIIAYCTIGYRSALLADKYKHLNIYNLIGGVLMWSHENGPFVNQKGQTKKVHIYSKGWNYLNSQYLPVTK